MHLIHRTTCRVCQSSSLTKVIDLGEQHLQGSFVKPGRQVPPLRRVSDLARPLRPDARREGVRPPADGAHGAARGSLLGLLVPLGHQRRRCANHLAGHREGGGGALGSPDARVLDIGCNDGTLLAAYPATLHEDRHRSVGRRHEVPPDITVVHDLFPSDELSHALDGNLFDIITSIAMFYDLEDPVAFARAIKRVLAPDGLWCFEMSYMPTMLRMTSYDTICHEHLEYYSLAVLEHILRGPACKLVNVRAQLDQRRLASAATRRTPRTARYRRDEFQTNIKQLRQDEFDLELDTDKPYRNFQERVNVHKQELMTLLKKLRARGQAHPRLRRLDQGQHDPAVVRHRQPAHRRAPPSAIRTSSARARSAPTSRSSARRSRARPSRTTTSSCPGTSATSSSSARRGCSPPAVGMIFPLPTIEIVRGN